MMGSQNEEQTFEPCPFCHAKGTMWWIEQKDKALHYAVMCQRCLARGPSFPFKALALSAWQNRGASPRELIVKALRR